MWWRKVVFHIVPAQLPVKYLVTYLKPSSSSLSSLWLCPNSKAVSLWWRDWWDSWCISPIHCGCERWFDILQHQSSMLTQHINATNNSGVFYCYLWSHFLQFLALNQTWVFSSWVAAFQTNICVVFVILHFNRHLACNKPLATLKSILSLIHHKILSFTLLPWTSPRCNDNDLLSKGRKINVL